MTKQNNELQKFAYRLINEKDKLRISFTEMVRINPDEELNEFGCQRRLIHLAIEFGNIDVVRNLLLLGADTTAICRKHKVNAKSLANKMYSVYRANCKGPYSHKEADEEYLRRRDIVNMVSKYHNRLLRQSRALKAG